MSLRHKFILNGSSSEEDAHGAPRRHSHHCHHRGHRAPRVVPHLSRRGQPIIGQRTSGVATTCRRDATEEQPGRKRQRHHLSNESADQPRDESGDERNRPPARRTVVGSVVSNPYGDVQVEVVVRDGQLSDVEALELPSDRQRSQYINSIAGPELRQEALQARSANIDVISGATYTSQSYAQSLQNALDQAGL